MILSVQHVSKRFGGLVAVNDVSFDIREGTIVGLIGANGAGKSTVFNIVAGVLRPSGGEVIFRGRRITGMPPHRIASAGIVKTSQLMKPFHGLTVTENVMVPLMARGASPEEARAASEPILRAVALEGLGDALPRTLPHAQRRRLEIARALGAGPSLLLLDEALAGLNETELGYMLETVREIHRRGITIFLIEHVLAAAMTLCETVIVLDKGRLIASGSPAEVTQNPAVIDAYLGIEI